MSLMADTRRNTWGAKIKRTLTCLLPVSDRRRGQCVHCGACCKLPTVCPWLRTNDKGEGCWGHYSIRPMNCRKYPRTEAEHFTKDTCGF